MTIKTQIKNYIDSQDDQKRADLLALHSQVLRIIPEGKLWFLDGKDDKGKIVSNPNIGYGQYTIHYKDGSTKEFYQIGLSANTSGISVYIMGLADKKYLSEHFGTTIGKATVTGYCIKFKSLKDIKIDVLEEAIRYGVNQTDRV
ncbi:DUF1801 domain-containing protein [Terrimonas sp. NA20]|uniref:DUF1801 domain-containing protein n=1 Tax=Terrimonas ginsenosidimutans TaxID=2908004 RepID=A0ABS9KTQ4_9BACT|nr:DUF1801 domain-containing protein [Terrimonas ginsenosidimutans]MCG2615717.1 DUF1801 domain-containing protein [Terrimonas ginsenosidimutans]